MHTEPGHTFPREKGVWGCRGEARVEQGGYRFTLSKGDFSLSHGEREPPPPPPPSGGRVDRLQWCSGEGGVALPRQHAAVLPGAAVRREGKSGRERVLGNIRRASVQTTEESCLVGSKSPRFDLEMRSYAKCDSIVFQLPTSLTFFRLVLFMRNNVLVQTKAKAK